MHHGIRSRARLAPMLAGIAVPFALVKSSLGITQTAADPASQHAVSTSQEQPTNDINKFEEVTVTARRREELAQQVPVAITVITPEAIRDNNIATIQDVQELTPGLTVTTGNVGQRDSANVTIRGQGWGSIAGQPAVAMYLNEVPIPTDYDGQLAGGPGLLFDLENVQVLKGPQGTLFGRNTMGGAVLLQTARPKDEFDGRVQVGFGNYNDREIDGAVDLPIISDTLLSRIAFNGQVRDGISEVESTPSHPNGFDLDNRDFWSLRGTVTWKPAEQFQNDTILTYQHYTNHGSADFLVGVDPNGSVASTYPNALSLLAQQQALGARTHLPIGTDLDGSGGYLLALENLSRITINDGLTFRNILGYRDTLFNYRADVSGTGLPIFNVIDDRYPVRQFSEEAQLVGTSFSQKLDWVIGGFFSHQGPPNDNDFPRLAVQILMPVGTPADVANTDYGRQLLFTSKALFGQGTYDLSDLVPDVKITGGLRYTWDDGTDGMDTTTGTITRDTSTSSALTYTAGLDYQATSQTLLYFTTRRGYREGGATIATNGVKFPFGPEYVTDYEVGLKSDWSLAGVPVRTNLAVYYENYSDIQVDQLIPYPGEPGGLDVVTNASAARLHGAELETLANLTQSLQVGANLSSLSFEYTKFGPGVDAAALVASQTANRIPFEYGLNARYKLPVPETVGDISWRANWHWQRRFGDFLGTSDIPAYGLLNTSVNWENIDRRPFDAQLFVSNVTNRVYESGGIGFLGFTERTYGDPRMWGIRFGYHF